MFRLIVGSLCLVAGLCAQDLKGWTRGKGFGWVYGKQDEIEPRSTPWIRRNTGWRPSEVKTGRVFDLGVRIDRSSYTWPGHSPTEIMSFRSPEGVKHGNDTPGFGTQHRHGLAWHSCALFISDNIGTQIDGLGHVTTGDDNHWYNGFREQDYGTDFGVLKADADTIPPVVARGVLIDVAAWKGVDALPGNFAIGSKELEASLAAEKTDVQPGDVVLIRTGTLRYWGATGADHQQLQQHDSAGLTLEGARWLVEQKGAVMIGADTSGLESAAIPQCPTASSPYTSICWWTRAFTSSSFTTSKICHAKKCFASPTSLRLTA